MRDWVNNPCEYGCDCGECYSRSPDQQDAHHCTEFKVEIVHDHQPDPEIACRKCGCEGFRLEDKLCDGCHEADVFDLT